MAIPKAKKFKSCSRRCCCSPLGGGEVCWFAQASMGSQSAGRRAATLQDTDEPRLVGEHTEGVGALWVLNLEYATSVCGKGYGKVVTGSRPKLQGH